MRGYLTTKQAAKELKLQYPTLLSRIRKGKIKSERFGWAIMVPKSEVTRLRKKKK